MKTSRWLCGIAGLLFGAFGFLSNAQSQNPPWPPLVLVIASDPSAAEEGSDPAQFLVVRVGPNKQNVVSFPPTEFAIDAPEPPGDGTPLGTVVALVAGGLAVVGGIGYSAFRKRPAPKLRR